MMPTKASIFTIGHSNHTWQAFLQMLKAHRIRCIVDVRRIPKSLHVPWTHHSKLKAALKRNGIAYEHVPALTGRRSGLKQSINTGWRNKSFRAYADYMQTVEFYQGLKELMSIQKQYARIAVMCAEAVPWRCHRNLIADALVIRSYKVLHIMNANSARLHQLTQFALVDRHKRPMRITYPAA